MNVSTTILIITASLGLVAFFVGVFISIYPQEGRFLRLKRGFKLEALAGSRALKPILSLFTSNRNSAVYRFNEQIISSSETDMSVQALYLLKLASVILIAIVILLIRYTNIDIMKSTIISKSSASFDLFSEATPSDYAYNLALYNAIVKRIGTQALQKLDDNKKLEAVKEIIPVLIQSNDTSLVDERAETFVKTYNSVQQITLLDWSSLLSIFLSFWLPELLLFLKRLLLSNMYKKEIIKLENVFELLGSIQNFKTIHIIDEMEKSSKPYSKHLRNCIDLFKTDKETALETLKLSVKSNRFSKLVDVMRIYALVDKTLAIQILERNRLEK